MDQKMSGRFVSSIKEIDMLLMQLEIEPIAIGSHGFHQINYAFLSQVSFYYTMIIWDIKQIV